MARSAERWTLALSRVWRQMVPQGLRAPPGPEQPGRPGHQARPEATAPQVRLDSRLLCPEHPAQAEPRGPQERLGLQGLLLGKKVLRVPQARLEQPVPLVQQAQMESSRVPLGPSVRLAPMGPRALKVRLGIRATRAPQVPPEATDKSDSRVTLDPPALQGPAAAHPRPPSSSEPSTESGTVLLQAAT